MFRVQTHHSRMKKIKMCITSSHDLENISDSIYFRGKLAATFILHINRLVRLSIRAMKMNRNDSMNSI